MAEQTHAPRVLIVDDDERFVDAMRLYLQAQGIDVVGQAANGAEGVRTAEATRPEVVLMDLDMPIVDGITATKDIRASLPDTKVIVVSGSTDMSSVAAARDAGAAAYVPKAKAYEELAGLVMPRALAGA